MFKNSLKKIGAVVCSLALAAQFAVAPVNAAYISEDQAIYKGDMTKSDPISLKSDGTATGSIVVGGLSGAYTVSFDLMLDGSHPAGDNTKGNETSSFIYFGGSGSGKVGGYLMVGTTVTDTTYTLLWKGNNGRGNFATLTYGETYHIDCKLTEVGTGKNAAIDIFVYDAEGKTVGSLSAGELRNFSGADGNANVLDSLAVKCMAALNSTSSMDITNIQVYREIADAIDTTVGGTALAEDANTFELSISSATELAVANTVKLLGSATTHTATSKIAMADGTALPDEIELVDGKIVADVLLEGGAAEGETKSYDLILTSTLDGYSDAKVSYPVTLTKVYATPAEIVDDYQISVSDDNGAVAAGAVLSDDITLDAGNAKVEIVWESSEDTIIDPESGVVMPSAEDTDVTLTARVGSPEITTYFQEDIDALPEEEQAAEQEKVDAEVAAGTAIMGKIVEYTYTVKGVKAIVDAAIASMNFVSADDAAVEMDFSKAINSDFVIPASYSENSSVKFEWVSENDKEDTEGIYINSRNVAEIRQDTTDAVETSITGTISYMKNGEACYEAEVVKEITIDVTQEGTADKYIVRCDTIADENFAGAPSSGDTIEDSKLDLNTEGIFGSKIQWTSSVPTVISNSGKVTKPSSSKRVTLTATISKGDAESEKYSITNLLVEGKKSSGGSSGGGGGSSSSNLNSTVSSTGNRTSPVEYKGTLTPTTSLSKGDITTAQVSSFSDLSSAAWAKDAITALYNKGIVNGKTDSTFAPNDAITRAEFAKIVVKAFGLEDTSANVSSFSDVTSGDWYYTAVASAYNKGIIKGYEDGRFGVNDQITRQDMAVIIYRAAQVAGKSITAVNDAITFADNGEIASYAADAVATLQKGGIINGMTATTFAPKATATRAQAAQMIYGIVK